MDGLIVAIIIGIIVYFLFKNSFGTPTQAPSPPNDSEPVGDPANQLAAAALRRVMTACQETGGDGFNSLIVAASADGKVSRDELRIIMWFCESVGTEFSEEDAAYVTILNSGVNMNVTSSAGGAAKIAADCTDLDLPALARLYAAHTAIGKPWNKTAKRSRETLSVIEAMIADKAAPERHEQAKTTTLNTALEATS